MLSSRYVFGEKIVGNDLFRQEALEAQSASNDLFGRPTGVVPPAWSRITTLLAFFMIALIAFLLTANFARKETVRGKLRPIAAEARIYALEPGIVSEVLISDGAIVEAGSQIAVIKSDRVLSDGSNLSEDAMAALHREQGLLKDRLRGLQHTARISEDDLDQRITDAARQEQEGRDQFELIEKRLITAHQRVEDTKTFLEEGLITQAEHLRRVDEVSQLEQSRLQTLAQIGAAEAAQSRLVIERRRIRADLVRDEADINQRITQLEAQMRQTESQAAHVIAAPIAGQVSALQARVGERADPSVPLATIGEPDAELIAELYLPSRAIAFVEPGQLVKLQYDALPYQKFGIAEGSVLRVSSTSLLPQELGVLTQNPEPLYRVEVGLSAQAVEAFGKDIPLQSGMELTADIVLEDRKLMEWLLEPLRSVR